jgi:tetratricopeptide (TPR) repeat protein
MKNLDRALYISLVAFFLLSPSVFPKSSVLINRIEGTVYDPNRRPVENIYVELTNDVDTVMARTRTNGIGRFSFLGMPAGRFIVKVLPFGTNLMQQSQDVQITNVGRSQNDTAYIDIYLRYDKRSTDGVNETSREVVFVQEVPPAAKKLYEDGIAESKKDQEKGMAKLEESLRIFPEYFDALHWLGKAYVAQKNYEKAYPYLMRAIDVNSRSYSDYYSLGFAFYQLKQYPAAAEAARATTVLVPDSMDAQLLYGTLLRITEKYPEAEKALLKANTLAQKKSGEVHWQLALLYNRLNRNQDTIDELEVYLKLVPDTPDKKKIQDMIAKLKVTASKKN